MPPYALAIHGGAGLASRADLPPEREAACQAGLRQALLAGKDLLLRGFGALDACVAAVKVLEDDPWFNAGRGSVLAQDGSVWMDASVMDGATRRAGAVAALRRVRYPVLAAKLVMEQSGHVFLVGPEAERWATAQGLQQMPEAWFLTDYRREQLARAQGRLLLDHEGGTVGAVARDRQGHLAAATSTGGMTGKLPGRAGDTAVVGAGTWAQDDVCAASGTGNGEAFIRLAACRRLADLVELRGMSLEAAGRRALAELGATGGFAAVDAAGRVALPFNSAGMFRGWLDENGEPRVAIWQD